MKKYLDDLPEANTYSLNKPCSQTTFFDSNTQLHLCKQVSQIPTNSKIDVMPNSGLGMPTSNTLPALLLFLTVGVVGFQSLVSNRSRTRLEFQLGWLQVRFYNESDKVKNSTKE